MAKVYSTPKGYDAPEFDIHTYKQDGDKYLETLSGFCKEHSKCKHAGEVIRYPCGDGYAEYMVYTYTMLIHIELGDAWNLPDAHIRGLRKADIIKKIESQKRMVELFS